MITITLWSLAAFFNACMDAFENEPNFNESIFKKLHKFFWLKTVSWAMAKKVFGYKLDSWHISKSLMLICIVGAAFAFRFEFDMRTTWQDIFWYMLFAGADWCFVFWLTYHKLFQIK